MNYRTPFEPPASSALPGATSAKSSARRAEHFFWDWKRVDTAVDDGADDVVSILNALPYAPSADPAYIGTGPVEDLLTRHPGEFETVIAERCRRDAVWAGPQPRSGRRQPA